MPASQQVMAARAAPFAPQVEHEIAQLLRTLEAHATKSHGVQKSFRCRKATYPVAGLRDMTVDSWRFQDWDYKRDDLPTYARGLFTHTSPKPEILIRGYDKFFNIGEVRKTSWENIIQNTRGPYELSMKENGCIIFISGITDEALLICSKHSTGAREDADVSHAIAGEKWLDKHLASVGKSRADLARELRKRNATAVAELCDDSFEEHILPYGQDRAGLFLHGINLNLPEFTTYPSQLVQEFAERWGFRKTDYLLKDDVGTVKNFLEKAAETGAWEGKDVEGFVIRCQARDGAAAPWHDWFFKYKFEEPYLMYRQWREVTKAIISGKPPRYKKHKILTDQYIQYARRQLAQNPSLGKSFVQNHGIIAMRNGFLKEKGLKGAGEARKAAEEGDETIEEVTKDIVLVPVATLGCGKTTVALALRKLFGWRHIQNDDFEMGKKDKPKRFAFAVHQALSQSPVVFADRNNHQKRERKQLIEDIVRLLPRAHFVALHYLHERPGVKRQDYHDRIRNVTRHRVLTRGDNHQTIQSSSKTEGQIISIMDGFMQRFEPVHGNGIPDEWFDAIIDLDVTVSSKENLKTVVTRLRELYPKLIPTMPTEEEMDQALNAALHDYHANGKNNIPDRTKDTATVQTSHQQTGQAKSSLPPREPTYFCISVPTEQVMDALKSLFSSQPPETARIYREFAAKGRIQAAFHVTLIHQNNAKNYKDIWKHYKQLYSRACKTAGLGSVLGPGTIDVNLDTCRVELERIVWDKRIICIVVRLLDAEEKGLPSINNVAHITVGTANPDIRPKESNALLAEWLEKGSGDKTQIWELPFEEKPLLEGKVRAAT